MRALQQTSVGVKVFLVCTFVALLVSALGSAALYHGASTSLRDKVCHQLQSIASTAALHIDTTLLGKIRSSDPSSREYKQLRDVLVQIKDANPGIRSVYVLRTGSMPDTQELISHSDPERVPGEKIQVTSVPSVWASYYHPGEQGQRRRGGSLYPFSGYATLRNRDGSIAGILCVEMSPQQLRAEESDLRFAAGETLILAVLFSLALGFSFTQAVLRPLNAFTKAAQRVSEGDFDFRLRIAGSDEIADLASTFNSMISNLRDYRNKMIEQSTHDPLTGLSNHMHFHELLNAEASRANRFGRELTILIIDIDRFKKVNDSFGHAVGDSVLGEMGALIRSNLREIDMAARYGADEFAIILPEASALLGMKIAEEIRASVDAHRFSVASSLNRDAEFAKRSLHVTVTIGAATYPRDHHTKEGVMMAADIALCRAKHVSRNSTFSYDPNDVAGQHIDPVSLYRMLRSPDMAAIQSLAAAVDARDHYTSGHSARVVDFSMLIADGIDMSSETKDTLRVAALLHDLGKIGIPDSILNKPDRLSEEEIDIVRQHPSVGAGILGRAPQLDGVLPGVLYHHERFDGSGYPQALAGDEIPLIARILAIADSFDAMTSDRPYRKALSAEEAVEELVNNAGTQFDPQLVEIFIKRIKDKSDEAAA